MEQQFLLASRLAGLLSDSSRAVMTAQSEHSQLESLLQKQPGNAAGVDFDKRISEANKSLTELQEHAETLYKEAIRGDNAPTVALTAAAESTEKDLKPKLAAWDQLQKELPALNKALRNARLPEVRPELPPPRDLNVADEE